VRLTVIVRVQEEWIGSLPPVPGDKEIVTYRWGLLRSVNLLEPGTLPGINSPTFHVFESSPRETRRDGAIGTDQNEKRVPHRRRLDGAGACATPE
jgi:hypothetical protein